MTNAVWVSAAMGMLLFSHATAQTISTFAGGPPANGAPLNTPVGPVTTVAVNSQLGVVYTLNPDPWERSLLKITSVVSTVAQSSIACKVCAWSAAGGDVRIGQISRDAADNIFITDPADNVVIKVAASGTVTRSKYNFQNLQTPITVDQSGNVYVVDSEYNSSLESSVPAVLKLDSTLSTVTRTGVRGGSALVAEPGGGLLVADDRIIRYAPGFATFSTVLAASATIGGAVVGPVFGMALGPGNNIYFSDGWNNRVLRISSDGASSSVVAGDGTAGFVDDVAATKGRLSYPLGLAFDSAGNLYIADSVNQRIRKVSVSSGYISTVAGNGTTRYGGDGGPAASAQIDSPAGLAFAGNTAYLFDGGNAVVRKVDGASGVISTLAPAGRSAKDLAALCYAYQPCGHMAVDPAGSVYVAITKPDDSRVLKLSASGVLTTIASGRVGLAGLAVSPVSGLLHFGEAGRIIRVESDGRFTTVAGNGQKGFGGDGGPATQAVLSSPVGLAFDRNGNLYFSDADTLRVRKITTAGVVTTIAGNGSSAEGQNGVATAISLSGPQELAVDSRGNVYIANYSAAVYECGGLFGPDCSSASGVGVDDRSLRRVTPGGTMTIVAWGFDYPFGVAVDSADNVLVSDVGRHRVYKVTDLNSGCDYQFSPSSIDAPAAGTSGTIFVTTGASCQWSVVPRPSWIHILGLGSGTGSGSFNYQIMPNTGDLRNGSFSIGTGTVPVTQQGLTVTCAYSVPGGTAASVSQSGGSGSFDLSVTASSCAWTASSSASWLTLTSPTSGSGSATIKWSASANPNSTSRTATINIASVSYQVSQAGTACTLGTLNPVSTAVTDAGVTGSITLPAGPLPCQWAASSNSAWAQVFPLSGTGAATITYTIFPNFGTAPRSGSFTIAGQTFSYTQSGNPLSADDRFIQLIYFSFMGRLPSAAERTFQVQALHSGLSRTDIGMNFLNSTEFNLGGRFVAGLYVGLLDREAEYGGWLFQRNALLNGGVDQAQLITNFLTSQEFTLRFGNPSNDDFVRFLYQKVLLRNPTAAEVAFQSSALTAGTSRTKLAQNFLNSQEFRIGTGPRLMAFLAFATLLQRQPLGAEFAFYRDSIASGTSLTVVVDSFVKSPEFATLLK